MEAITEVLNGFSFDQDDDQEQRFVVHDGRIEPEPFDIFGLTAVFAIVWGSDKFGGAKQGNCAVAEARYFGVGFDRTYQARKNCHPFGRLGSVPNPRYESFPRHKWRKRSTGIYQPPHATRNTDTIVVI